MCGRVVHCEGDGCGAYCPVRDSVYADLMRLCFLRKDAVFLPIVNVSLFHGRTVQGEQPELGLALGFWQSIWSIHVRFALLVTVEEVARKAHLRNAGVEGVLEPAVGLRLGARPCLDRGASRGEGSTRNSCRI